MSDKKIELYEFIKKTIAEVGEIDIKKIKDDSKFQDDLDMDSLEAVEILHKIEKKYNIKIKNIELENVQTLKDIYKICLKFIFNE